VRRRSEGGHYPKEDQMKIALLAAALMVGGAAYAQDTTQGGTTTGGTDAGTSSGTVAAGNSAPARDARGIPVISADATAPAGWNSAPGMGGANPSAPAASQGSAGPMPPCTRKVTDHCTQTYERHRNPS
jgi:hypothetical protein